MIDIPKLYGEGSVSSYGDNTGSPFDCALNLSLKDVIGSPYPQVVEQRCDIASD